ncbi:hypothetical protein GGD38_002930 [Chitinophagaceae bacterium OAS944]|nr:hypothetical protein [Chitinophagaceae bacterium OAS944]
MKRLMQTALSVFLYTYNAVTNKYLMLSVLYFFLPL